MAKSPTTTTPPGAADKDASPDGGWHKPHRNVMHSPAMSVDSTETVGPLYGPPTSVEGPGYEVTVPTVSTRRYTLVTVGLPARGKTFLAFKLSRYLAWLGHKSTVFNVRHSFLDAYRAHLAKKSGATPPASPATDGMSRNPSSSDVPSPASPGVKLNNTEATRFQYLEEEGKQLYRGVVDKFCGHVEKFFGDGGQVAILNDDFVTADVRDYIKAKVLPFCDEVFFLEVVRGEDMDNSHFELLKVADEREYGADRQTEHAKGDFYSRLDLMRSVYQPTKPPGDHCIRIRDGTSLEVAGVKGFLPSRMTSFLMNVTQMKIRHPIFFTRHGQSEFNLDDRLGGNPGLTKKGYEDALALRSFMGHLLQQEREEQAADVARHGATAPLRKPVQVWSSQLTRTIQTAGPSEAAYGLEGLRYRCLNEIHAGICEGLTYAGVKEKYPLIHEFRKRGKYSFRYPEGESYQDLVARLEPLIMDLENADRTVVVVAHQAVLRCLLAYFGNASAEHSVNVEVPHRTVWRVTYNVEGVPSLAELQLPPGDAPNDEELRLFKRIAGQPGLSGNVVLDASLVTIPPSTTSLSSATVTPPALAGAP